MASTHPLLSPHPLGRFCLLFSLHQIPSRSRAFFADCSFNFELTALMTSRDFRRVVPSPYTKLGENSHQNWRTTISELSVYLNLTRIA